MRITIRLSDEEHAQLLELIEKNETTGFENPAEFFRLMIKREYNKGRGLPKPTPSEWQTAARVGRPKWEDSRQRMQELKQQLARLKAADTKALRVDRTNRLTVNARQNQKTSQNTDLKDF